MKGRPIQGRVSAISIAEREIDALAERADGQVHWLLESLLLIVALATLIKFAIPNYNAIVSARSDSRASDVYDEVAAKLETSTAPFVIVINGATKTILPDSLMGLKIPDDVTLEYAVKADFPGFFSIKLISVTDAHGKNRYRMIEIDEKRVKQVITK